MLKALLRKQWLQWFSFFLIDKRNGKKRSVFQLILYALLFLYLFGVLAGGAYWTCSKLYPALHVLGMDWLYFTLSGLAAIILGLFLSLFSAFSGLYQAKDNDLLFSMPIPPRLILFSRMLNCYLMGLLPMALVLVPALIAGFRLGTPTACSIVFSLLLVFILGFLVLVFACLLGWVVALVSRHVRHKNLVTVVLSLAFMGLYFYGYSMTSELFRSLMDNIAAVSENIRGYLYPFFLMGKAFEGDPVSMLLFTALTAALFGLTYWAIARSFLKLSIAKGKQGKRKAYKESSLTSTSPERALMRKELRRLLSSPTYLLNGALGAITCCAGTVVMLFKMGHLRELLQSMDSPELHAILPLALAGALAALSSMNMLSASSISMEGKNFWILRTLPVSTWKILKAKWRFHMLITLVPLCMLYLITVIACRIPWAESLMILLFFSCFAGYNASMGLNSNLRRPNLLWTNETAAVKENFGSLLCLYAEWGILLLCGVIYFACFTVLKTHDILLPPLPALCVLTVLVAVLFNGSMKRLKRKGVQRFENL